MPVLPLSELADWELSDPSKDIRGRRLLDGEGHSHGIITELLVDTDQARVQSVRTHGGQRFPVEPLEIRESDVLLTRTISEGSVSEHSRIPCQPTMSGSRTVSSDFFDKHGVRIRSGRELRNAGVIGTDGHIDKIHDIYFDDRTWDIRF